MLRRHSWWIAAVAIACGDNVTGPATRELALSVCPTNEWVAFQNEGGPWTRLGGSNGGDVTIRATERLVLAIASTTVTWPNPRLYFVSADQAQQVLACFESNPYATRSLSGTVQGLTAANFAQLSVGPTTAWLDVASNTFSFGYAAAGTRDLFAMRLAEVPEGHHVDRMIVRRAQAHADGTVPLLDFESGEALLPAQNTLSWTASGAHVQIDFRGADRNILLLQSMVVGAWGDPEVPWTLPFYSVPADRLVAGDLHILNLYSEDRSLRAYYHQPADMAFTLGPALMEPTFTTVATTPARRVHAEVPWQPEYDGYVHMYLTHPAMNGPRSVNITVTREHVLAGGGSVPAAWAATVPDLSGVAGAPSGMWFEPGTPFDWTLFATNRRWEPSTTDGAPGTVDRSAGRYGTQP